MPTADAPLSSPEQRELLSLLWALRDQSITARQIARLEALVTDRSAARRTYLEVMDLVANLRWYAASPGLEGRIPEDSIGLVSPDAAPPDATKRDTASSSFIAAPLELPAGDPVRRLSWFGGHSVLLAASMFAVLYYGAFAILAWSIRSGAPQPGNYADRDTAISSSSSGLMTATLSAAEDCVWEQSIVGQNARRAPDPLLVGTRLYQGDALRLKQGAAEIRFDNGVTITLEAPSVLVVDSAAAAFLEQGKLVARVPHGAKGFAVRTPSSNVIDLGTEFGVEVDRDGATDVQVFVGRVLLESHSERRSQSRPAATRQVELRGGDRGHVAGAGVGRDVRPDSSGPVVVQASQAPTRFLRRMPSQGAGDLLRIEHGGSFEPGNLATRPEAKAFAIDDFDGRTLGPYPHHRIAQLNDGRYGNQFSWIGKTGNPAFAGISFGSRCLIESVAFGRDNGGDEPTEKQVYNDFWEGTYTLQYTTAEHPDASTPASQWTTLGTVTYRADDPLVRSGFLVPMLRHRYAFPPVEATAVRILVPGPFGSAQPTCIDELEVYGPSDSVGPN